ncbi:flagellar hook-associated protein FlgK [Crenobacter sp. SG2303]|uniref:Flagellar hook-associated protein 1 n=1 Tax=Crenobacter oryzisoli TaxID=3056844 RepID=A0ABT7XKF5_9NEIS|nr:flagellar hook-associated protein FlgK [Crenobacter sp. SG2303]MDN0074264.1 flagellar hook-associated protein FlgK [Crenobacter sp. SG2303]
MPVDIYGIGLSGLNAAQGGLSVIGNNIANVNTPGYNRQVVNLSNRSPLGFGSSFFGTGVDLNSVSRVYDKYLTQQVQHASTQNSSYQSQLTFLNQLDSAMSDSSSGLSSSLQNFYSALQGLSSQPSSLPSRQSVISMGQALASQFQSIDSRLTELHNGANAQITSSVGSVNALVDTISKLNQQITALSGQGAPNDLMDQRDQAMSQLNQQVGVSAIVQADGSYSVFLSSGQALVQGNSVNHLATQPDPADPQDVQLTLTSPNGTNTVIGTNSLNGGTLAGLFTVRDGALKNAQTQLGNMAIDFSTAMNYQSQLGVDLNGNTGGPMFTDLTSYVNNPAAATQNLQMLITDPQKLPMASNLMSATPSTVPAGNPVSNGVALTGVSSTLPGNYGWTAGPPLTAPNPASHPANVGPAGFISINGNTMQATITGGPANGAVYNIVPDPTVSNGYKLVTGVAPATTDVGIQFKLSAQLGAGMTFTVVPNAAPIGTGDNGNLLSIANLQTAPVVNTGVRGAAGSSMTSVQSFYATLVSTVGSTTNQVQSASTAQSNTLQQVTKAQQSVSGVNLDEEATNMLRYQQAYQASSKLITIAQQMFQSLIAIGG